MKHRTFTKEFKRQLVEESLSGISTPGVLCRKHNIARGLLHQWQKQYAKGKYDNEPLAKAVSQEKIQRLERMVGRSLLPTTYPSSEASEGGAVQTLIKNAKVKTIITTKKINNIIFIYLFHLLLVF